MTIAAAAAVDVTRATMTERWSLAIATFAVGAVSFVAAVLQLWTQR